MAKVRKVDFDYYAEEGKDFVEYFTKYVKPYELAIQWGDIDIYPPYEDRILKFMNVLDKKALAETLVTSEWIIDPNKEKAYVRFVLMGTINTFIKRLAVEAWARITLASKPEGTVIVGAKVTDAAVIPSKSSYAQPNLLEYVFTKNPSLLDAFREKYNIRNSKKASYIAADIVSQEEFKRFIDYLDSDIRRILAPSGIFNVTDPKAARKAAATFEKIIKMTEVKTLKRGIELATQYL